MKIRVSLVGGGEVRMTAPFNDKSEFTAWLKSRLEDRFTQYLELPGGAVFRKTEIAGIAIQ